MYECLIFVSATVTAYMLHDVRLPGLLFLIGQGAAKAVSVMYTQV